MDTYLEQPMINPLVIEKNQPYGKLIKICTIHKEYKTLSKSRKKNGLLLLKEWVENELKTLNKQLKGQ